MILYHGSDCEICQVELDVEKLKSDIHLNVLKFSTISRDWAEFVYNNRETRGYSHDYDIVVGPVADDGMAELFAYVKRGIISIDGLAARLEYAEPTEQYCFLTKKGLGFLKKL